jgi:N-methylhydantoinase A
VAPPEPSWGNMVSDGRTFAESEVEAIAALTGQGFASDAIPPPRRSLDMRYRGQEHTVEVPVGNGRLDAETLTAAFHERHRRRYTFALEDTPVEVVNLRVAATARISLPRMDGPRAETAASPRKGVRSVRFGDGHGTSLAPPISTPVYARAMLHPGWEVVGPAIVEEPSTTTVVHPGQRLTVDAAGNLVITAAGGN